MEDKEINILYIDDEEGNLNAFKAAFRRDFNVFLAQNAQQGIDILNQETIHIILTDQRMPETTGVEFLEAVLEDHPEPIRILVTGYTDMDALVDAVNKGHIFKYISKPWDVRNLKFILEKAYEVYELKVANTRMAFKLKKANEQLEFMLRQKLIS